MSKSADSKQIRAGSRTYFFDLEKTSEGKPYLRISETRYMGKDKKHERKSIHIFAENIAEFANVIAEMSKKIA